MPGHYTIPRKRPIQKAYRDLRDGFRAAFEKSGEPPTPEDLQRILDSGGMDGLIERIKRDSFLKGIE